MNCCVRRERIYRSGEDRRKRGKKQEAWRGKIYLMCQGKGRANELSKRTTQSSTEGGWGHRGTSGGGSINGGA